MRRLVLAWAVLLAAAPTPGRAEDAFTTWLTEAPWRAESFAAFQATLAAEGVSGVVADQQLWMVDQLNPRCATSAFAAPPAAQWPAMIATLRLLRDQVVPAVGAVRVVSAWRSEAFNTCLGGAARSAHRDFLALDLVPLDPAITRAALIEKLCAVHRAEGRAARFGLGIYSGRRFHIDTRGFRGWGGDHRAASFPCPAALPPQRPPG
ncbi:MAG: hypothetical protein K2P95_06500 [Hyphomonadaceae bacterium]|nr:hypothetical protein [Hyphomonadaceae bacterium]